MPTQTCPHCNEELPMLGDAFCSYCREPLVDLSEPEIERPLTRGKKDFGYADAQFANQLVDQGVPDDDVVSRLSERGVSEKRARRFIDEAKSSRLRRDRDKQYSITKRIGLALVVVGFFLSVSGILFFEGRFFRIGLGMLFTGAILQAPRLDIRR